MESLVDSCGALVKINAGLLARLGFHKTVLAPDSQYAASIPRPNALVSPEFEKLRKTILKAYPSQPPINTASPPQGYEQFQTQASKIASELEDTFQTFVEVSAYIDEAYTCLRSISADITVWQFDLNPTLMADFMDLLVGYAKMHLYLASIDDARAVLSIYAVAYKCVNGKTNDACISVGTKFQPIFDNPWKKMQEELKDISDKVGVALAGLHMPYINGFNLETLRANSVLNPSADVNSLAMPAHQPIYQDLVCLDKFQDWVIFGMLACPAQFAKPQLMDFIKLVAQSGFVTGIFRQEVLNFHDEFEKLFSWFPSKAFNVSFEKVKPKKVVRELAKVAVINAGLQHRERRSFLAGELKNMLHLFEDCPALVAPKFPMLLAALSLAKAEVLWYFIHWQRELPTKVNVKSQIPSTYEAPQISGLVSLIHQLSDLVRDKQTLVQRYYLEYLTKPDRNDLEVQVEAVLQHTSGFSPSISHVLREFVSDLSDIDPTGVSFDKLRLNWDRVLAMFLSSGNPSIQKLHGVEPLIKRMNKIVIHTKYVDQIPILLSKHAEFPELYWHPAALSAELKMCMGGSFGQPTNAFSIVSVLRSASYNLSPFCPEEQELLGSAAILRAEQQFEELTGKIERLLTELCFELGKFDQQVAPIEAAHRLQRNTEKRKQAQKQKGAKTPIAPDPLPGFESQPQYKQSISKLAMLERNLSCLMDSVQEAKPLVVSLWHAVQRI
jgi:NCK-associated protein 1